MKTQPFLRFAGYCGILTGLAGLLYSIAFIILKDPILIALFLMIGGILTTAVITAIYQLVHESEPGFSIWALLLGVVGAAGATIHGGYDLANSLNPPASANLDLPNAVDPRGLLTFGLAGISLLLFSWLMIRGSVFPRGAGYLGFLSAFLLLVLYLGRLIILQATHPFIAIPALLQGFVVNPAWYLWIGIILMKKRMN